MVLGSNTSLGFLPNQVLNELLDACLELWIDLWRGLHGFRALIALFLFLGLRAVALRSVILGVLGPVFLLGGYFLPFAGEAENAGLDAVQVSEQEQRLPAAIAPEARAQVALPGKRLEDLHVGLGEPRLPEMPRHAL